MCNNQQKKTINAEHVLMALDSLGYREDGWRLEVIPDGMVKKVGPRLFELTTGSQDAGSHNLGHAFFTIPAGWFCLER